MSDVDRLLSEYIEEHRSGGEADPVEYLERLEGTERRELEALIDGYLARAPRRRWNAEAFQGSAAEAMAESLEKSLDGVAGLWPAVLPGLRDRARLKRAELVARLAAALGASGREEKVADYYHRMEQGTLPASGVSDRVLEALGKLVGTSVAALRSAGQAAVEPGGPAPPSRAVFARTARIEAELTDLAA